MTRDGRSISITCEYCGTEMVREPLQEDGSIQFLRSTIDHILPLHSGGKNDRENLKMACLWCNNGKEVAGDCIAAFRCIEDIIGRDNTTNGIVKIGDWFRNFRKGLF